MGGLNERRIGMSNEFPETKKQYITAPGQFGGTGVYLFRNGRLEKYEIVKDSMLRPYTESVENLGYRRAYYIPVLEKRLEKAYAAYREAVETLEKAKPYPLELDENEAEKLMAMFWEVRNEHT
jgi:CRISPR/Cas system-associated exonuclease Cas4 (RecB family)